MNPFFTKIKSCDKIDLEQIPILPYELFYMEATSMLHNPGFEMISYYGFLKGDTCYFICVISNSTNSDLYISGYKLMQCLGDARLTSISQYFPEVAGFELAISNCAYAMNINLQFLKIPPSIHEPKHIVNPILDHPPLLHPVRPMSVIIYID